MLAIADNPKGTEKPRRVLIVAGGTGGHIAPALAVGEAVRGMGENIVVRYVTGSKPIERQAFAAAAEFPDFLSCSRAPSLTPSGLPELARYAGSLIDAWRLLRLVKPHAILATGGYVCAPVLTVARMMGIPFYLHESNAVPGQVTRLFAKRARRVFVAHEAAAQRLGEKVATDIVGTPVRRTLFSASGKEAIARFGLVPNRPVLFAIGGSQGARGLNEAILDSLAHLPEDLGLQVIWACGPLNYKSLSEQIERLAPRGVTLSLHPYLDDVQMAYAAADLVLSRAGASTLAEISALGLPSILVPFPHAKDNHQFENARGLHETGAAILINESELTGARLAETLTDLLRGEAKRAGLSDAARRFGRPRCAEEIAARLLDRPISSATVRTAVPLPPAKLTA